MIGSSKTSRENYPRKCFWTQEEETRVKFNPRLSANRLSNNWAQRFFSPAAGIFGVGRRPKPRAAKPREKTRGSPIKTWQKPETALEKSLAPRVSLLNKILLDSVCMGILFNSTSLGIHFCKTPQLYNFKTRHGGEIYLPGVDTNKGYWTSTF